MLIEVELKERIVKHTLNVQPKTHAMPLTVQKPVLTENILCSS